MPQPPSLPEANESYLWVIKPQVNIRYQGDEKAAISEQLSDGDSVLVFENRNGWYRIKTAENNSGWIRTDLLGPRRLSIFRRALAFSDSLRDYEKINLFFDKKLQHKRIYLNLPSDYYASPDSMAVKVRNLIAGYQKNVYAGEVTTRILKPNSADEYETLTTPGQANPDPLLPVLPFGILRDVRFLSARDISLVIEVPDDVEDKELLPAARRIAVTYPLTFRRVRVQFNDSRQHCRFQFEEGQEGEKFQRCPSDNHP